MSGPELKRCRGYGRALHTFKGYSAVIPHIQNVYGPEEEDAGGWCIGLKYQSGVFEFFLFRTEEEAKEEHDRLLAAIEAFYVEPEAEA